MSVKVVLDGYFLVAKQHQLIFAQLADGLFATGFFTGCIHKGGGTESGISEYCFDNELRMADAKCINQ
jgi:hypothetical protein